MKKGQTWGSCPRCPNNPRSSKQSVSLKFIGKKMQIIRSLQGGIRETRSKHKLRECRVLITIFIARSLNPKRSVTPEVGDSWGSSQ